jgi:hypothetical protein
MTSAKVSSKKVPAGCPIRASQHQCCHVFRCHVEFSDAKAGSRPPDPYRTQGTSFVDVSSGDSCRRAQPVCAGIQRRNGGYAGIGGCIPLLRSCRCLCSVQLVQSTPLETVASFGVGSQRGVIYICKKMHK